MDLVKLSEVKPEPQYVILSGKSKEISIKCSSICDTIRWALSTTEVEFAPTMIFQTRVTEVKLTNTSTIKFNYTWHTSRAQMNECPFDISRGRAQ
jgi:hypothetical protein